MKDHGVVGRAQLKSPTLKPRTDRNRQPVGASPADAAYPYDRRMPSGADTFGKLEMALEDAKRTLEQEKMLIPDEKVEDRVDQTDGKDSDDAEFMDIRSNPDPVVRYAITTDETKKASRSTKKTKMKDDRLVEAIKRALGEENSVTDGGDSYTQVSRDGSSFYTDDELINFASSTMSGSLLTDDTDGSDDEDTALGESLLSGFTGATSLSAMSSFADDFHKPLKGRRHSQSEDDGTFDDTALHDEDTLLSGYTDYTPMTSSVTADFQSPFSCTTSPKKKQERTQRSGTDRSVYTEPDYLKDGYNSYDDNVSYDYTYTTRGTMGVMQDALTCGQFSLCFGEGSKYQPKGDSTVGTKETRSTNDFTLTPLTVKERLNRARSKKSVADDATEATAKKMNTKEDATRFQEEENANAFAETLDNVFWKGDGVFGDESVATGFTSVGAQSETKKTDDYNVLRKGDDAFVLLSTSAQSKSLQKTDKINDLSNQNQSLPATSEVSITSSTKKKIPYLLRASRSFGKSISFRKQKSSATQQPPISIEVDVDDGQTMTTLPSDTKIPEAASHQVEALATEQNMQRGRSTTAQPTNQGYEMPRKKSFRQMIRSRSRKRSLKQPSIAESPASPARTVDASVSTNSTGTDPELSAISDKEWRSTIDKSTGKTYFYNKLTKEVRWEAPEGFEEQKFSSPVWKAAYDTTTGRTYYYNRQTKAVTWKKPYDLVTT